MRKNATKIAAMMLSLALTVTSVNVPTTASAATKVKLNTTKATLYVGGTSAKKTKTLTAKVNGKKVKATFTSNKPKVAKVNKSTGKVTAKKAGTATITAKYNGKKATCKITVKQYVTNIVSSQNPVEVKEGERFNLAEMISVVPSNASNKELKFTSDDSLVVAVNKDGTIVKGVKEGNAAITIKAKDGSNKTARVVVNVIPADDVTETPAPTDPSTPPTTDGPTVNEAAKITATLTNPLSEDMTDTLMVGNNAEVRVQVLDADGNPVANKDVVLTSKTVYEHTAGYAKKFDNLTDTVLRTDANGYATFVYGVKKSVDEDDNDKAVDATSTKYVSSYKLTIKVVGNDDVQANTTIKFAAINVNAITGIEAHTAAKGANNADTFEIGTNAKAINGTVKTNDRNGQLVDYIGSQQVSSDAKNHAITFNTRVSAMTLVYPTDEGVSTDASDIKEEFTFDTGKYETYATKTFATGIKAEKASKLQYATVNFGKLSLSQYSRFTVQAFITKNVDNPTAAGASTQEITLQSSNARISGEKVESDFAVQIPIPEGLADEDGYLYVMATIQSKGQVNTDVNEGFTVKNIVGVRRKTDASGAGINSPSLSGLTVEWAEDKDATYTINAELPANSQIKGQLEIDHPDCTYLYKLPAFPRTGNAIITVLNSEKKAVAYYAVPTYNNEKSTVDSTLYRNENKFLDDPSAMYQLSQDEALNKVGTVTSEGNIATVDSKLTGVTHVIGTISSTNPNIKIDATNEKVYTSVHWNPIPNAGSQAGAGLTRAGGAALVGQQIVLKAQLTDVNGNPVTIPGVAVDFYDLCTSDTVPLPTTTSEIDEASVVRMDTKTNALGQAELILVSGKPAEVLALCAKANGSKYNLKYTLGSETVDKDCVDLYWVDANLLFEADATYVTEAKTTFNEPVVDTKTAFGEEGEKYVSPIVGENWLYEVRTNGDLLGKTLQGYLNGKKAVTIEGLTIQTAIGTDSVGNVTNFENGKANVTSTAAGTTKLVNTLTSASVGSNVTFNFEGTVLPCIGEGTTTLDKKLTLSVKWRAGVPTAQFIIPTSLKADVVAAATGGGVPVYVLVQDANGNVIKDRDVELKVTGVGLVNGAVRATVKTNEYGIAPFNVTPDTASAGTSSTLTATVYGLSGTYTSSIKWITLPVDELEITKVAYDYNAKTITLTFNNDIYVPSVIKEVFTVKYKDVEQIVTAADVKANKVVLSIPALLSVDNAADSKFEVAIKPFTTVDTEITYGLVSVDAQKLVKDTITFNANSDKPDED